MATEEEKLQELIKARKPSSAKELAIKAKKARKKARKKNG